MTSSKWVGTAFSFPHAPEHYAELRDVAQAAPVFFRTALAATGALCLLGTVRLATHARAGTMILLVVLLPAPLLILGAHLREAMIYKRYLIFALPSFAILLGAGLEGCFKWVRPPRAFAAATIAVMLAYLGGYAWLSRDVRSSLRRVAIHQASEVVLMTRPSLDPFAEENRGILTACWQSPPISSYDPNVHQIHERGQLLALVDEADRTGRELYVSYGRPWLARRDYAELIEMVERKELFEPVATLYGFEPRGLMHVYRYRGQGKKGVASHGIPGAGLGHGSLTPHRRPVGRERGHVQRLELLAQPSPQSPGPAQEPAWTLFSDPRRRS